MAVFAFSPKSPSARAISPARRGPLKLGFLSPHNPYDCRAFSGTCFHAARALEARSDVALTILGHRQPPRLFQRLLSARMAMDVDQMDFSRLDAVVGMVATPLLKGVITKHPNLPYLHVTDATPTYLREAYGWAIPEHADTDEAWVAQNAAATVYSSKTIASRAGADLGVPGMRSEVAPFGLNFIERPQRCPRKSSPQKLKLLFVGTDWIRKGGDIALEATKCLRAAGRDAELTVVGQFPKQRIKSDGIRYVGYLNKNKPKDAGKLAKLYSEAHVLLLPSRADCTPMVIAEAFAHGTPVVASDVGGIAAMIKGSGHLLAPYTPPQQWANAILSITDNKEAYDFMSDACFDRCVVEYSWDTWARTITALADQIVTETFQRDLKAAICS